MSLVLQHEGLQVRAWGLVLELYEGPGPCGG